MRRYPYVRCTGDKNRICLLCNSHYLVVNPTEINAFCPTCFTKERKHEMRRVYKNIWRAKQANALATLTVIEWLNILDHFKWQCAYCLDGKFEVLEHIISIADGGGTTALNCIPACGLCNSRKDRDTRYLIPQNKIEQVKQQLIDLAS